MNTKTDGISSGLLAAAWLSTDCIGERYLCFSKPRDNDPCETLVRLSDAEKLIAEKDAEIKRLSFDLARAKENEACAKVCDRRVQRVSNGQGISYQSFDPASVMAQSLSEAIRARMK